ncbi:MAG: heavy-metal-associated domain-containing protein [Polaromonas sp.]|uniref:heavy-metal-associated domain-containing protein n=1 Tax=Polaromonas sp. TaxID=1869339 RepID=UPI0024890D14|nr:heavy-metal-associated domain-containing protein [Polaromonas sp.]MDI1238917.1 heavy-metal-associated domain-containing protein [Polaromonas sp.]MDI1274231.1 heavy-metal-associated domain-containing protein [Polaromonas sp.]MDI1340624.1 heavy-metal-associated domain-containing protein [Polaromonas sp.]
MIAFQVEDMTSVHGVNAITRAVKAADKMARIEIDLASQRVAIGSAKADASVLGRAIREAGYTPVDTRFARERSVPIAESAYGSLWWG